MDLSQIALAMGASFSAGLNLYITIFALGLMQRLEWITLPDTLSVVANPWVMGVAGFLFLVEFVADKIPYVDNAWDTVHTLIRVPAGAFVAASAFGEIPSEYVWIAALLGGFISFTSHGAKAATRLAVNSTPEPFSNWFLSFLEDGIALALLWLVATYPYVALVTALVLIAAALGVIYFFYRFFRMIFRRPTRQPAQG